MKRKKLKIDTLKVESFVTQVKDNTAIRARGGQLSYGVCTDNGLVQFDTTGTY